MKGKLKLAANKKTWLFVREDGKEMQVPAKALTRSLFPLNPQKHDGLEVEYELDKGLPAKIYEVGATWQSQGPAAPMPGQPRLPEQAGGRQYGGKPSSFGQRERRPQQQYTEHQTISCSGESNSWRPDMPRNFHNPYNFIPAPQRKQTDSDLDDKRPAGHDHFDEKKWSGRIRVKLTTATPLLIPDAANAKPNEKEKEHKHFPTRLGPDGKPYLPPTSIKGMLRSAYEAITNSRMAVFEGHEDRLAFRQRAQEGLKMVPARVETHSEKTYVTLYTGFSDLEADGSPVGIDPKNPDKSRLMYAAWLRQYGRKHQDRSGKLKAKPNRKVWAYVKLWKHQMPDFYFWDVAEIKDGNQPKPTHTPSEMRSTTGWRKANAVDPAKTKWLTGLAFEDWVEGYVYVTGRNIGRKHDERIFFNDPSKTPHQIDITDNDTVKKEWKKLIENYAAADHENAIDPGTQLSYHIQNPEKVKTLRDGSLCYARVAVNGGKYELLGLYPVIISRELHKVSPQELLKDTQLLPTTNKGLLSPADRVFGWVNQDGQGAYRGNLRISPANCNDQELTEFGAGGLPLSILGQPKPQQARFYVAACANGKSQRDQISSEAATYASDKGLRGRKVYPHHAGLPTDYWTTNVWDSTATDRTQEHKQGFYREYLRSNEAEYEEIQQGNRTEKRIKLNDSQTAFITQPGDGVRDKQNRSLLNWVSSGTEFTFDIDVTNLSNFELGAFLWLLELPDDHFHRLGGGKPLGFGSVQLNIVWEATDVRTCEAWQDYYGTLDEVETPVKMEEQAKGTCLKAFRDVVAQAYGDGDFEQASFIKAFRACARGFNKPIHYPRARPKNWKDHASVAPHPGGKAFQWFVANEKINKDPQKAGPKLALPDLTDEAGLPYLDEP